MEKIAYISGGTFVYWSSIILTLAVVAAMAVYAGVYIFKSGNVLAAMLTLPVAMILSAALFLKQKPSYGVKLNDLELSLTANAPNRDEANSSEEEFQREEMDSL